MRELWLSLRHQLLFMSEMTLKTLKMLHGSQFSHLEEKVNPISNTITPCLASKKILRGGTTILWLMQRSWQLLKVNIVLLKLSQSNSHSIRSINILVLLTCIMIIKSSSASLSRISKKKISNPRISHLMKMQSPKKKMVARILRMISSLEVPHSSRLKSKRAIRR